MAGGIKTSNLSYSTSIDALLGLVTQDDIKSTRNITIDNLARQLVASGPVAAANAAAAAALETAKADLADQISGAEEGAVQVATWAELASVAGTRAYQPARVIADAGTHTDPVVGGTVGNKGEFSWSTSPAGWKRIGDLEPSAAPVIAEVAEARGSEASLADRFGTIDGIILSAVSGVYLPGSAADIAEILLDSTGRPLEYRTVPGAVWYFDATGALALRPEATERHYTAAFVASFSGDIASAEIDANGRVLTIIDTSGQVWVPADDGSFARLQVAADFVVQAFAQGVYIPGLPVAATDVTLFADGRVANILGHDGKPYAIDRFGRYAASADETTEYDVVVYGSSLGGLMALARAAIRGKRVCLIEPYTNFGGMHAAGLCWIDTPDSTLDPEASIMGGLTNELYFRRIAEIDGAAHKYSPQAITCEIVAQEIIAAYAARAVRDAPLERPRDVLMGVDALGRPRIRGIFVKDRLVLGKTFVDASYEGDLMAAALGPSGYVVGREAASVYGEAGAGFMDPIVSTNLGPNFQYYTGAGSPTALGYPFEADPGLAHGDGDDRVQAYNFRVPLTRNGANRLPLIKPEGYSSTLYLGYLQYLRKRGYSTFCREDASTDWGFQGALAGSKLAWNKADLINRNAGYPDGNWTQRKKIVEEHVLWQQGLMWCVQNDPVALDYGLGALQADAADIGLCADEFESSPFGHGWPFWLYPRETRRLKSIYLMTLADVTAAGSGGTPTKATSIGKWSYAYDIHAVRGFIPSGFNDRVAFEGSPISSPGNSPIYQIPIEALLPQASACTNLVVPVCAGFSHVAWGPQRLEIAFGFCGEAAGELAAWHADNQDKTIQAFTYSQLAAALVELHSKL